MVDLLAAAFAYHLERDRAPGHFMPELLEAHARGTSACLISGGNSQRIVIGAFLEKRRIDAFAIGMRSLAA